jgi:cellulose synthase/poly-beta-1,6-N-acetylglucosamine synthase-like glycosyltransferase
MEILVSSLLVICAGLLAIPVTVFFIEVVAALALPFRNYIPLNGNESRSRLAVLVPAHDEGAALLQTIADIQMQLRLGDRLLVVADNCTDDTAGIARAAGAEVVERHDPDKRGKGYALDFGIRHLALDPPKIVIIIDADCRLKDHAIDQLVMACASTQRPVQALDLMIAPDGTRISHQIAEFAWRVKNWVRPLGLRALGLPCQLMGTGMAFQWEIIRSVKVASGHIVEDLEFGLELAKAGTPPLFCPSAVVTSHFPISAEGEQLQRKRWELGHINMIIRSVPHLLFQAIAKRNWSLLALVFDLAVPPLSLLGMLVVAILIVSSSAAFLGSAWVALTISAANLLAFMAAAFLAWIKYGRDILPPRAIVSIAPYVLKKFGLYRQFVFGKTDAEWTRTDRSKPE